MRHPTSSRGKTPATCHECREANPDLGWCEFHKEPHPKGQFKATPGRPIGIHHECRDAQSYRAAAKRARPGRTCVACLETRESWYFRGGRNKNPTCRQCGDAHPGLRWCIDCREWLPEDRFNRTGINGAFWTVRCKLCRSAHSHGTTIAAILARQGVTEPICGACGSRNDLKIDHDHACCPAQMGCDICVRGYLCHACNTAEGLLRTPERARALADYMERHRRPASM